ncbi:MAG: exodeoxyribonuclease III [Candidatus Nanopelagicales bacterium]|nr:exodeoxyribonuclease III [Candidatus Nanopelagicales bacterium]MDZ4248818.1 exodeoxyribonuclease III [Candidatus Nanopelagicales bacterium]
MRIATWNVNSVARRVDRVAAWLARTQADVLCIQETKCPSSDFPSLPFAALGYESAAVGNGPWNGVAVLSRVGLENITHQLLAPPTWEGAVEPRALGVTCDGLRVWSVYVPNGRALDHPHFQYKLNWLRSLTQMARVELASQSRLALLGDFNVAPTNDDVYNPAARVGQTHVTAEERDKLRDLEEAGLTQIVPRALKYDHPYTFWDYRQLAFPQNHGMRIDLAFLGGDLPQLVSDAYVDREARKGKGTSDHAPVVIDLDFSNDDLEVA